MSVIERAAPEFRAPERAVFVTDDDRRARRLRRGAFAGAALAFLWLAGLGVGMFGFGSLPGVSLVGGASGAPDRARPSAGDGEVAGSSVRPVAPKSSVFLRPRAESASPASVGPRTPPLRPTPARGVRRASAPRSQAAVSAKPAQTPVNPAQRQRGWARRGATAPRGQTRKAQLPPPPAARGQRRGQVATATSMVPVPFGQAKKAEPPPPPPPA